MPRTLFIDADACPVTRESIDCARRAGVAVVIAGNSTQNWNGIFAATTRAMPSTRDAAFGHDARRECGRRQRRLLPIIERLQTGDVVVTQDIGLASMVLGRDAAAIGVRGRVYDKATIDMQLFIRHEERRCAAPAVALAVRRHLPAKTAPALNATSPSCCTNQR